MNKRTSKFLSLILAITLAFATLGLAACGGSNGGSGSASTQEQDNCYGDDMPVVNN